MKMQVFSILDKAVGAYLQPFFCRAKGEALRSFIDAVGDEKGDFCKHPDDYVLFWVSEFDTESGIFLAMEPQRLLSAREAVTVSSAVAREMQRE